MQDLKIVLIQSELHWEQPEANLAMFEEKLWQLEKGQDIIILPEMFTTGFTMNTSLWEHKNGKTVNWMKQQAAQFKAVVTGSLIIKDENNFYNRLVWADPSGEVKFYDKRHLFRMAEEDKFFYEGKERLIVEYKGWKILPQVCYDLRFPVWSRNIDLEYDLAIYVANWPAARSNAWKILLQARAVENLAYIAGLNRVGEDGKGIAYNGASSVINYKGEVMQQVMNDEAIIYQELQAEPQKAFREKFPAWRDADKFRLD